MWPVVIILHLGSQPTLATQVLFEIVKNVIEWETLPLVLLFMEKEIWVNDVTSKPALESVCFPLLFFSSFSCTIYGVGQSLKEVGQVFGTTRKEDKT